MIDHPLQLSFCSRFIAGIIEQFGIQQRGAWRVSGTAKLSDDLRGGIVRLGKVVRSCRLTHRLVEHTCLFGLILLIPTPALHSNHDQPKPGDARTYTLAVSRP